MLLLLLNIAECNSWEYQCADKHCISLELLCDGSYNCDDGSDEGPDICSTFKPIFTFLYKAAFKVT